jgi:hypothetical protein
MKKVLLFVAVVAATSFASCKKDRTCTCTDSTGGSSVVTYTGAKKGDARAACLSKSYTYNTGTGTATVTETCTLN